MDHYCLVSSQVTNRLTTYQQLFYTLQLYKHGALKYNVGNANTFLICPCGLGGEPLS